MICDTYGYTLGMTTTHSPSKVRGVPGQAAHLPKQPPAHPNLQQRILVLRLIQEKYPKLAPQWEGPFIVSEVIGGAAYRLKNPKIDEDVGSPWNVANLRLFYP